MDRLDGILNCAELLIKCWSCFHIRYTLHIAFPTFVKKIVWRKI